jgi:GntR family transcriptional regulator / MocR family aminotransferase
MQTLIPLKRDGEPLSRQIYAGLRHAVLGGTFGAGERLPSTRDLAEQLDVSRTVVVLAYEQLLSEGFVVGRVGAGTYVPHGLAAARSGDGPPPARPRLSRFGAFAADVRSAVEFPSPRRTLPRFDFSYGRSDVECFPFEHWWRLLHRCARRP